MQNLIKERIVNVVKELYGEKIPEFAVEKAPENQFGDYAINVCFLLSKTLKKAPFVIGEEIKGKLEDDDFFSEVQVAKPGYINVAISNESYKKETDEIIKGAEYFKNSIGKGVKYNLEFVSANPVGPLNVVSGRAASFGDAMANILVACGYDVTKEFYVNDFGKQMDLFGLSVKERYFELFGETAEIPEGGYNGEYVIDTAKKLKEEKSDSLYKEFKGKEIELKDNPFRSFGLEQMLIWQKKTLAKFGVEFDVWFSETSLHEGNKVEDAIKALEKKGFLEEKEGALWFKTMQFGDDKDRVVKKQDGDYTYFASDIAYMHDKISTRGFDEVVNVLGPDHHGYIKRLESIEKALYGDDHFIDPATGQEIESRLKIKILQQVNLLEKGEKVKMSKRAGKIIELDELVDEVGKDAARYFFVMRNYNTHLDFDIELAKEKSNENPVFYVQYAYARISSIFRKAEEENVDTSVEVSFETFEKEEKDIIIDMIGMKDLIRDAAVKFSPSSLTAGIYDIVSKFHSFYNKHKVVSEDKTATAKRLYIMKALLITLGVCFDLIGIEKLDRM